MSDPIAPLNLTDDADRWLDRLADGELNPDQQRRLLAALETHPDGWRRCALAFVEAQTLRAEFRHLTTADNVAVPQRGDPKQPTMTVRQPARRNSALAPARWLAIAASLLVAFTLGIAARGWLPADVTIRPSPAGCHPSNRHSRLPRRLKIPPSPATIQFRQARLPPVQHPANGRP